MISRLLPILSLVVLAGVAFYAWYSGALTQAIRPTVIAIATSVDATEGAAVDARTVVAVSLPVSQVPAGAITLGRDMSESAQTAAIARLVDGREFAADVQAGRILTHDLLRDVNTMIVLRTTQPVEEGAPLTFSEVSTMLLKGGVPDGAIVFPNLEAALRYMRAGHDIRASRAIEGLSILSAADITGGGSRIYGLAPRRELKAEDTIAATSLEAREVTGAILPATVVFSDRLAAEEFLASGQKLATSRTVSRGALVTLGDLDIARPEEESGEAVAISERPQTLAELEAFMLANPGRVLRLTDRAADLAFSDTGILMVGGLPEEGIAVDIWAEVNRTDGTFGVIEIARVASGIEILMVEGGIDHDLDPATGLPRGMADGGRDEDPLATVMAGTALPNIIPTMPDATPADDGFAGFGDAADDKHYWVDIETGSAVAAALRAKSMEAVAFAVPSARRITDVLGNGSVCGVDSCSMNIEASRFVEKAFGATGDQPGSLPGLE